MKVILIRHGEPRYDEVLKRGYPFQGYDLGKLTEQGIKQAKAVALDKRLEGAQLIIASPYTRALQTAAIISRITNLELTVENDVHEWMPSVDFKDHYKEGTFEEFIANKGEDIENKIINWETNEQMRTRALKALLPYKEKYDKIIVVCHGIIINALTKFGDIIEHCGIKEIEL